MVRVHVFFREMVNHVSGLSGREEGGASAVTEEAEVAVVSYDVDGGAPGDLGDGVATWADVIYCADVAAVEAEAGARLEH